MLLFPSLACANFDCLRAEVESLDRAGADGFHVDVSDGTLYPELAMGMCDFRSVRRATEKIVDVHLYMTSPLRFAEAFAREGADIIYVFPEGEPFISFTLNRIRELGKYPGLAIGWGTAITTVRDLLPLVDYVVLNSAVASPSRGSLASGIFDKLKELDSCKSDHPFKVVLDGAVTASVIENASCMGAEGFAIGSGCLFGQGEAYAKIISDLRKLEHSDTGKKSEVGVGR